MSLLETGGQANAKHFASKLVEWKDHGFQGLGDCSGGGLGQSTKRVLCHSSFLLEPERAAQEVWEAGGKKVAPNGAVMRTAVTGIPYFWDTAIVQQNTLMMCRVTHADPRCVASCLIVSGLIAKALQFLADDTHNSIFCVSIEDWISEIVVKAESVLDTDAQVFTTRFIYSFKCIIYMHRNQSFITILRPHIFRIVAYVTFNWTSPTALDIHTNVWHVLWLHYGNFIVAQTVAI